MEFNTRLTRFEHSPLWAFHIPVPDEVARLLIDGSDRRVVCTLNESTPFQCALMPRGDGSWFINVNKEIRRKLRLQEGMTVRATLRKDESDYGLPMPEEMAELLEQDEEGNRLFHALSPGKQRTLLFIVGKPKTAEIRLKKAIVVIGHLKAHQGKIHFKLLNEDMKDANRR